MCRRVRERGSRDENVGEKGERINKILVERRAAIFCLLPTSLTVTEAGPVAIWELVIQFWFPRERAGLARLES